MHDRRFRQARLAPGRGRTGRRLGATVLGSLMLSLAGCASSLEVRSLATGRADRPAYALSGSESTALWQEARRLCPQGGEVLRQSALTQRPETTEGHWAQVVNTTSAWIEPPRRSAQLVVLCHEVPGGSTLSAGGRHLPGAASAGPPGITPGSAEGSAATPAAAQVAATPAAAPIGPTSVEW